MLMKKIFYIVVLLVTTISTQAQDPHFSQFFASPLVLNPAYTGKFNGTWRLTANETQIVISSDSLFFPLTVRIAELTQVSLKITTSYSSTNIRMTFKAK